MTITPFHFDASEAEDERLWQQVSGKKKQAGRREFWTLQDYRFAVSSR
jgi:hypothetical protein